MKSENLNYGLQFPRGEHLHGVNVREIKPAIKMKVFPRRIDDLRHIYRKYFKKFFIFRLFVQLGYRFYVVFIPKFTLLLKEKIKFESQNDFITEHRITTLKVADAEIMECLEPLVLPVCDKVYLQKSSKVEESPEITITLLRSAQIYGGTNMIIVDDVILYHDLFHLEYDVTSEELHRRVHIRPKSKLINLLAVDKSPIQLSEGAVFLDACAQNYAHWLSEVLPRVALFCKEDAFKEVPIVVDANLHPNIMDSLFLVTGREREIITLPIGRSLSVDKLYLTSVAGYVPFGMRKKSFFGRFFRQEVQHKSHGIFNPKAIEVMLKCLKNVENIEQIRCKLPEKIFIRRNTGVRKIKNSQEIEKLFFKKGYVIVEPEKLTFIQQYQIFNNAKKVAGPTGAGLANLFFCRPKTQVIIFMGKHEDMIYRYWVNMLSSINIDLIYVLCKIVKNRDLGIHADFSVDTSHIEKLLN